MAEWQAAEPQMQSQLLRANFWWMSTLFALNHGVVTTPLVVASSLLGGDIANVGNGVLYVATLLSSLLLGTPVVGSMGPKAGILFGMFFYCVYIGCFGLASLLQEEAGHDAAPALKWISFVGGSACGGIAAGVLWTAQGGYFGLTAAKIAEAEFVPRESVTASLAGNFAFIYLGLEVLSKLGFSALQHFNVATWKIAGIYLILGLVSFGLMTRSYRFESPNATISPMGKVLATVSLWSDPVVWLLSPTNLAFGFSAAFMNGFVNANFAKKELGVEWVSFLAAITAAVASLLSRLYGPLASRVGKGPVICIGAASFICIPASLYILGCCNGWGWWIIVLYLLQGSGRAVYESTNRAMFSDFFPGPKVEGAFANCMLQASASFAACFFLQTVLKEVALASTVATLAALTPICVVVAKIVAKRRETKRNPDSCIETPLSQNGRTA